MTVVEPQHHDDNEPAISKEASSNLNDEHDMPAIRSSSSLPKPKGILKHSPHQYHGAQHNLTWDEENLALTEINKDSLMKITEPKTPFVRYNALTDEIEGDIPDLSLSGGYSSQGEFSSPMSDHASLPAVGGGVREGTPMQDGSEGPPSRRTSFSLSSSPRPGTSMSGTSSRSTSFNLPAEARKDIGLVANPGAEEVEVEEEMDEETAAKHAAFVRARKGHYSNEAEAMKRAAELMDEDDDENVSGSNAPSDTNDDDSSVAEDVDDEDDDAPSGAGKQIPPVPPLPAKYQVNGKGPQ